MRAFGGKYQILQKIVRFIFTLALTIPEILTFQIFDLQKVGQGHEVQFFVMRSFDGKYQNLQKSSDAFLR